MVDYTYHCTVLTWQYPTKQNLISVHSVFPSVYVQVRQWGAWKLHPYNSSAKKSVFYHKVCPFGSIWNMLHTQNFVVMIMLVTIAVTRTKLVEANQHHCPTNTMLVLPMSTLIECKIPHLIFGTYWSPPVVCWNHFWVFPLIFLVASAITWQVWPIISSFCCNIKTTYIHRMTWFIFFSQTDEIYCMCLLTDRCPLSLHLKPLGGDSSLK